MTSSNITKSNFTAAILSGANLRHASLWGTIFGNTDLSVARNREFTYHRGPSEIGVHTIIKSQGKIPDIFLRGCGVPDIFIEYISSLVNQPIQYYSCFISFSTKDEEFARRLHNDLQAKAVRCWFAPHDIQGGKKVHEQIEDAIRVYDKLLLILSPHSMNSEWVKTEIAKARKEEIAQKRRMLFPVRLLEFEAIRDWEYFDADTGKDTAREIREYYIPDFSNWKNDHDTYSVEFEKLLRDLKAERK